jgi:hypothetical protein
MYRNAAFQQSRSSRYLIAQRIALEDDDGCRRRPFDILALGEAGPRKRVAGVDTKSHGAATTG